MPITVTVRSEITLYKESELISSLFEKRSSKYDKEIYYMFTFFCSEYTSENDFKELIEDDDDGLKEFESMTRFALEDTDYFFDYKEYNSDKQPYIYTDADIDEIDYIKDDEPIFDYQKKEDINIHRGLLITLNIKKRKIPLDRKEYEDNDDDEDDNNHTDEINSDINNISTNESNTTSNDTTIDTNDTTIDIDDTNNNNSNETIDYPSSKRRKLF
jgi:hypothetical protein